MRTKTTEPGSAVARRTRARIRTRDLKATLTFLKEAGMAPAALDLLPDGTCRFHLVSPADNDDDMLDRELAEFRSRHGSD